MSTLTTALSQANAAASTLGGTSSTGSTGSSSSGAAAAQAAGSGASQQLAGNFDTFLQLLTTQLQNQDPLDPLDTNQFTQQLVEFASVEQQVDMNTNMQTLISMQQTTQATSALQLVGSTVTVAGNSATLSNATNSPATWSLSTSTPATATVSIASAAGTTAYSGTLSLNAGTQSFTWNGPGQQRPGLAGRDLHAVDQRNRSQWPGGHRFYAGARRRRRRQSDGKPADAHSGRTERSDQPNYVDYPLVIRVPPVCRSTHLTRGFPAGNRNGARAGKIHHSIFALRQILSRHA